MHRIWASLTSAQPTAKFASTDNVVITEGESYKAPLRLTGTGPWTVTYDIDGRSPQRVPLHDPNGHLTLNRKGQYRLVEVRDENCPGLVSDSANTFNVNFKARPTFNFQPSSNVVSDGKVWRHVGTCAGQEGDVALVFAGQFARF